jgi:hypothetical protein
LKLEFPFGIAKRVLDDRQLVRNEHADGGWWQKMIGLSLGWGDAFKNGEAFQQQGAIIRRRS